MNPIPAHSTLTEAEAAALASPLERAGLPPAVVRGCQTHFGLLRRWNQTHNLTRITDPAEAAVRHYLDCALPVFRGPVPTDASGGSADRAVADRAIADRGFADIGSGAGFPGLIAALVHPATRATLVEPSRKRASFLRVAAGELGLRDVRVTDPPTGRGPGYSWVLSRATFSRAVRDELWPYVAPGGVLWAWTTPAEQETWSGLVRTWGDAHLTWHSYELPGIGERVIATIART